MSYKKFKLSFEVGIDTGDVNDKLLTLILESLKMDIKNTLDKHSILYNGLIYSKDVNCAEISDGDIDGKFRI